MIFNKIFGKNSLFRVKFLYKKNLIIIMHAYDDLVTVSEFSIVLEVFAVSKSKIFLKQFLLVLVSAVSETSEFWAATLIVLAEFRFSVKRHLA